MGVEGKGEFSIINKTRARMPRFVYLDVKNDILGEAYSLSIAYVTPRESRSINKKYRGKDYPTNVLSFPLKKNEGELILCPAVIKKEAAEKKFDRNFQELVPFLVIHGMLHLKGLDHSSTMDKAEAKYDKKYFSGNRRGNVRDKGRGRRVLKGRKRS